MSPSGAGWEIPLHSYLWRLQLKVIEVKKKRSSFKQKMSIENEKPQMLHSTVITRKVLIYDQWVFCQRSCHVVISVNL